MFIYTEEQKLLIHSVSTFAKEYLAPKAEELDETEGYNQVAFKKMAELGLLGITADEKYGGANLGALETTLVMEKLAEACASTTLCYLAHSILCVNNIQANGSEAQKQKYLPKLISGAWLGGMAMTEPGAGSDALGLQTRAVKTGNKYILNGAKTYITNGPSGNIFVVYAKTGPNRKDVSTFIVESCFPGFKVSKKLRKMGMRASPTAELAFIDCEVPVENLIGKENDSISHMMKNLNLERITISGISLGITSACLSYTSRFVQERSQFGKPLSHFQMVQERIAEMATYLDAGRALCYAAAQRFDSGDLDPTLGAKCKLFTAPMGTRAGLDAIQLLGGAGYMKEYPVERYMRDAKLLEIGAGTNEIMRIIIAKSLLNLKEG
ncbi:MAG: acyl-CoA dehydrogenase family protein [Deltaproteobacteria bacterium]|nr:acyl-CoA dehydrogenase family protein [Deltaproteobacteria bacterium]